ncbi:maltokinase [Murinocardiopsis flavida]|uniref:Maltokinase n=1 Tax=Murinocardiopsis flavida TaxID=645275 RepID=A0A2P8DJS6_9ACTN|nr:phosphotransferase [Murinocardiopsis flavida]PSK97473.1 maltokinase [Murinocardiopsis flavida]
MTQLEDLLAAWVPRQRWFAGKGLPVEALRIESAHTVLDRSDSGGPELRILVVAVSQRGETARYQVLLGLRPGTTLDADLAHAAMGVCAAPGRGSGPGSATVVAYDAAHDAELTSHLLARIAADDGAGPVGFRRIGGAPVRTGLRSIAMTAEQSNTTLVFGEEYVLKIFRRLWPGKNPDLELTTELAGSRHVAPAHGWIEAGVRADGAVPEQRGTGPAPAEGADPRPRPGPAVPTTLAMLQRYLRSATDGWVLAATSVRDLYGSPGAAPEEAGGDFSGEAARLGAATASVHRALARALPTDVLAPDDVRLLAAAMERRLDLAVVDVPELRPYAAPLRAAFQAFADLDDPLPVQRVHGDYHLGQVVRTDTGWILLDFEGEPAAPVEERRRLSSPLRDVAGMLRSFDYAARHQLIGHIDEEALAGPARAWAQLNRDAFSAGYEDSGGVAPEKHQVVLRAFEYDKAVYEVLYEARNRPAWLRVPLDSIAALAAG